MYYIVIKRYFLRHTYYVLAVLHLKTKCFELEFMVFFKDGFAVFILKHMSYVCVL